METSWKPHELRRAYAIAPDADVAVRVKNARATDAQPLEELRQVQPMCKPWIPANRSVRVETKFKPAGSTQYSGRDHGRSPLSERRGASLADRGPNWPIFQAADLDLLGDTPRR